MAKKVVDAVRRTGSARSKVRQIVVIQGEGKNKVEQVLSTTIEKLEFAPQFRFGKSPRPIDQYGFKVGSKSVERFADATALVLKRHQVQIAQPEDAQIYVKKAVAIMEGKEALHTMTAEGETQEQSIEEEASE
jgi:hypothetical protein